MTRLFWYHWSAGCVASLIVFTMAHEHPPCLVGTVPMPPHIDPYSASTAAGLIATFVLLFNLTRLVVKTAATDRPLVFVAIYALALFPPFTYFAVRYWPESMAVFLTVLALLNACDVTWGIKPAVLSSIYLATATLISGSLLPALVPILFFIACKRAWRNLLAYIAVFGTIILAGFIIGGWGAGAPLAGDSFRGTAEWLETLRICAQSHLSMAYLPFILTAAVGITLRENRANRLMLLLILVLSFLFGVVLPASGGTVACLMAAYVLFVAGASCGAVMLSELADRFRLPHFRAVIVGLFLLPPVVLILTGVFR